MKRGVWGALILLGVLCGPLSAQDRWWIEHLESEQRVIEELASKFGEEIRIDPATPSGKFIRDYVLASAEAQSVVVSEELLERAVAVHRFKSRDIYAPGSEVFISHDGKIMMGKVASATAQQVTVQWQAGDGSAQEKTFRRAELAELNAPRYSPANDPVTFYDVTINPERDAPLKPMLEKTRSIVDSEMPAFVEALRSGDLLKATAIQIQTLERVYNDAMRDGRFFNHGFMWGKTAGQAWVEHVGVCHTQAGILFSAQQAELFPRMGMFLQLHAGSTSSGGAFHTWSSTIMANGMRVYGAPTWAQGNPTQGFAPNIEHLYGRFQLSGTAWGSNRIINSMQGTILDLPAPNPSGLTPRFVENLNGALQRKGLAAPEAARVLAKFPVEAQYRPDGSGIERAPQAELSSSLGGWHRVSSEAFEASRFLAAYLVKETAFALVTANGERVSYALQTIGSKSFLFDLGVFTAAARLMEKGQRPGLLTSGISKSLGVLSRNRIPIARSVAAAGRIERMIPQGLRKLTKTGATLATGMFAVDAMHGRVDGARTMIAASAYMASGGIVDFTVAKLFAGRTAGPPSGWVSGTLKLAVMLGLGEGLERLGHHWAGKNFESRRPVRAR